MRGYGSLVSWSRNTSHSSSRRCNNIDGINEEEGIEVSLGVESCGRSSLDTIQYSLSNFEGYKRRGNRSQDTINSTSNNHRGFGRRSSLTRHYYSCN